MGTPSGDGEASPVSIPVASFLALGLVDLSSAPSGRSGDRDLWCSNWGHLSKWLLLGQLELLLEVLQPGQLALFFLSLLQHLQPQS